MRIYLIKYSTFWTDKQYIGGERHVITDGDARAACAKLEKHLLSTVPEGHTKIPTRVDVLSVEFVAGGVL